MGLLDYNQHEPKLASPRAVEAKANQLLKAKKVRRGKRKKHKRKIPKMTYRAYMKSSYWRKRKNDYYGKNGGKKCAVCGNKFGVTLHHKIYDHTLYGQEPDIHLVALCSRHHQQFHTTHQLKRDMSEDTDLYVHTIKQFEQSGIDDLSWIH